MVRCLLLFALTFWFVGAGEPTPKEKSTLLEQEINQLVLAIKDSQGKEQTQNIHKLIEVVRQHQTLVLEMARSEEMGIAKKADMSQANTKPKTNPKGEVQIQLTPEKLADQDHD